MTTALRNFLLMPLHSLLPGEAEISRRQAFGAIRAEAAADAADFAVVPATHNIEEVEFVLQFHHKWTAELAALLENPDAKLPEPD